MSTRLLGTPQLVDRVFELVLDTSTVRLALVELASTEVTGRNVDILDVDHTVSPSYYYFISWAILRAFLCPCSRWRPAVRLFRSRVVSFVLDVLINHSSLISFKFIDI